MKKMVTLLAAAGVLVSLSQAAPSTAQAAGNGFGLFGGVGSFVDSNGDGINDNAPDDDGDGIPNHDDSDYTRPQDGSGKKLGAVKGGANGTGTCTGTGTQGANGRRGGR